MDDQEWRFDSRQGDYILLFSNTSKPALGFTQPPIHWVKGALSPASKVSGSKCGI